MRPTILSHSTSTWKGATTICILVLSCTLLLNWATQAMAVDNVRTMIMEDHKDYINFVHFTPDGRYLISGSGELASESYSGDFSIRLWDFESGRLLRIFDEPKDFPKKTANYLPNLSKIITLGDNSLVLLDPHSGLMKKLDCGDISGFHMVVSPNGSMAAVIGNDGVNILETSTGRLLITVRGTWPFAFSPDSSRLVTSRITGLCRWSLYQNSKYETAGIDLYDISTGKRIATSNLPCPSVLTFSVNGKYLVVGSSDGGIFIIDSEHGNIDNKYEMYSNVTTLDIDPSGKYLAMGGCNEWSKNPYGCQKAMIKIMEISTGELIMELAGFEGSIDNTLEINHAEFSPDGRLIAACGPRMIRIWDWKSGQLVRELNNQINWAFRPQLSKDGSKLAWSTSSYLKIMNLKTQRLSTYDAEDFVYDFSISQDTDRIAAVICRKWFNEYYMDCKKPYLDIWDNRSGQLTNELILQKVTRMGALPNC